MRRLALGLLALALTACAGVRVDAPQRETRPIVVDAEPLPLLIWSKVKLGVTPDINALATLMVLAAGLGPFAGTLALALHTTGVLGRLFAEALENTPAAPAEALAGSGAPALASFLYGTLPLVASQWLAYALYRWEMNIRMAAILGFVGAGGLGALLYYSLSLFQEAQASTAILAMLAMAIAVDGASAWVRRAMAD